MIVVGTSCAGRDPSSSGGATGSGSLVVGGLDGAGLVVGVERRPVVDVDVARLVEVVELAVETTGIGLTAAASCSPPVSRATTPATRRIDRPEERQRRNLSPGRGKCGRRLPQASGGFGDGDPLHLDPHRQLVAHGGPLAQRWAEGRRDADRAGAGLNGHLRNIGRESPAAAVVQLDRGLDIHRRMVDERELHRDGAVGLQGQIRQEPARGRAHDAHRALRRVDGDAGVVRVEEPTLAPERDLGVNRGLSVAGDRQPGIDAPARSGLDRRANGKGRGLDGKVAFGRGGVCFSRRPEESDPHVLGFGHLHVWHRDSDHPPRPLPRSEPARAVHVGPNDAKRPV